VRYIHCGLTWGSRASDNTTLKCEERPFKHSRGVESGSTSIVNQPRDQQLQQRSSSWVAKKSAWLKSHGKKRNLKIFRREEILNSRAFSHFVVSSSYSSSSHIPLKVNFPFARLENWYINRRVDCRSLGILYGFINRHSVYPHTWTCSSVQSHNCDGRSFKKERIKTRVRIN
jgi:hypothetical protein